MDLRRLKTIFIFILVALNIMFCAVLYSAQNYEKEERLAMTSSLTKLLAKNMIYLPEKTELPQSPKIYNFYLEKMFGNNEELADKLLDKDWTRIDDSQYKSEKGKLVLAGDEFKFYVKNPLGNITDLSQDTVEKLCRDEMQRLGIFSELYEFNGLNFVDDGVRAIFTAEQEGKFFFDGYISFDVGDKGITSISGRNMISNLIAMESDEVFFGITSILPDLIENPALKKGVAYTIVSITSGYYIGRTEESFRNILAIPVWQIATDSGEILYYDARNGKYIQD